MKRAESKNTSAQPHTLPPFPFQHLLPPTPVGGLTPDYLRTLSERLRQAVVAKTNGLALSEEEAWSFRENCSVIRKANIGLQLRNYAILEVYKTQQWRADYRSLEEFAKAVADLSKSQCMKCIDSAEISLIMVDAGLAAVAPRGRSVEELAKVPRKYRVSAWEYALEVFKIDGQSATVAHHALRDYCRDRDLTFGRRKANGSKNIGLCSSLLPDTMKSKEEAPIKKPEHSADWTNQLSASEEQTVSGILQNDLLETVKTISGGKSPVTIIGEVIREIASHDCNDQTSERMEAVFAIMLEKDSPMVTKLFRLMLCQLSDAVSQKIEQRLSSMQ